MAHSDLSLILRMVNYAEPNLYNMSFLVVMVDSNPAQDVHRSCNGA